MIKHLNVIPTQPQRVIILGSSGFVGKALIENLRKNEIDFIPLASADLDLTQHNAVAKLAATIRPSDAVVFLSVIGPNRGHDSKALLKNLQMAETVGLALQQAPCAQLIYFSSEAVYAAEDERVSVATRPAPDSLYGLMHRTREKILQQLLDAQLPVLILRPNQIYGPGCTHNAYGPNRFVRSALQQQEIVLFGNGEEFRDFVHIDDVISIVQLALQRRSYGLDNIASGFSISYRDLAAIVQQNFLANMVKITHKPRSQAITHRWFDNSDLLAAFPELKFSSLDSSLAKLKLQEFEYAY